MERGFASVGGVCRVIHTRPCVMKTTYSGKELWINRAGKTGETHISGIQPSDGGTQNRRESYSGLYSASELGIGVRLAEKPHMTLGSGCRNGHEWSIV